MPAVSVGLFRLIRLRLGSVINATGPAARSSFASMIPPGVPSCISASRTASVGGANGGKWNIRPKCPVSAGSGGGAVLVAWAADQNPKLPSPTVIKSPKETSTIAGRSQVSHELGRLVFEAFIFVDSFPLEQHSGAGAAQNLICDRLAFL